MFHKIIFSFALIIAVFLVYPTLGMAQSKKNVPIIADREVISYNADEEKSQTVEKYYRDEEGRTRIEQQNIITINNPISKTTVVLDSVAKTFSKIQWTQNVVPVNTSTLEDSDVVRRPKTRDVGSQVIEGIQTVGEETINTITLGNSQNPIRGITTTWASKKMQLLINYSYKDSLGNSITSNLKNIKVGVNPDESLFEIPEDYTDIAEVYNGVENKIQPNAVCPLQISYTAVLGQSPYTLPGTPATVVSYTGFLYVKAQAQCNNLNYTATSTFGSGLTIIKGPSPSNSLDEVYFYRSSFPSTGGVYFYKTNNSNPHLVNVQLY